MTQELDANHPHMRSLFQEHVIASQLINLLTEPHKISCLTARLLTAISLRRPLETTLPMLVYF